MRCLLLLLLALPGVGGAQQLLAFRGDLAFRSETVNAVAARAYHQRIDELRSDGRLDVDGALLDRLHRIMNRLLPAAEYERPGARRIDWEVHVCRRCDENASAMAGGKLLVGEEFIAGIAPSDDELAFLLAHEMSHVLAEHTREFATMARYFLGNGLHRDYEDIQQDLDQSVEVQLRMAPAYAQQELEADYMGMVLGARSGFDPRAMIGLLSKLHSDGNGMFGFHPDEARRLAQARAMQETARLLRQRGVPGRSAP